MSITTITGERGDVLRVNHADGGATLVIFGGDFDAIVTLDAPAVKRMSDKRLRHRAARLSAATGSGGISIMARIASLLPPEP